MPAELIARLSDWVAGREGVRAAFLVGSQARAETPADEWSDVDLVLVVDDPRPYLAEAAWVRAFGEPVLTFVERMAIRDGFERRVLYEDGQDLDVAVLPAAGIEDWLVDPEGARVLARGFRLLHDTLGLGDRLATAAASPPPARAPAQADLDELSADVWYHALWAAKKLRRGELWTAKECVDGYLKARLLTLLGWHARAGDPGRDTWHGGRFVERWADPRWQPVLRRAFAAYEPDDVARALWTTVDLWSQVEREAAERLGLTPRADEDELRARLAAIVPPSVAGDG